MPFPMDTGFHILPEDVQEAIGYIAHRGPSTIRAFWIKQLAGINKRAQDLMPILQQLRAVKTIAKLSVNAMANLGEAHDGSQSEKCFLEDENMPSVCTH